MNLLRFCLTCTLLHLLLCHINIHTLLLCTTCLIYLIFGLLLHQLLNRYSKFQKILRRLLNWFCLDLRRLSFCWYYWLFIYFLLRLFLFLLLLLFLCILLSLALIRLLGSWDWFVLSLRFWTLSFNKVKHCIKFSLFLKRRLIFLFLLFWLIHFLRLLFRLFL
jgi:hypothetical protein